MEYREIKVGIGDLQIALAPDRLITLGLGSCIGIALIDNVSKIAGLAHIMLPESTGFSNQNNPMKFADLAVPLLIEKLTKSGAIKNRLTAKIAGGASMFSFSDKSPIMDIGNRNIRAVKEVLNKSRIAIISEDLGGSSGRTMIVEAESGKVFLRTVGKGTKEL